MAGFVNHDVWKKRLSSSETRLIAALKDIITETVSEMKTETDKTASWQDTLRNGDLHCTNCGAIIEKEEINNHNWYYCYHCGYKMINPYGGKTEISDTTSGRYSF